MNQFPRRPQNHTADADPAHEPRAKGAPADKNPTSLAFAILDRRAYSERELATKLVRRGLDPDTAQRTVEQMREIGAVDDRKLAEALARSELDRQPAGRALIETKLVRRQIDPALAREIASAATEPRSSLDDALTVAAKHRRSLPDTLDHQAMSRRLLAKLGRRGFDPETAYEATRRTLEPERID